MPKIEQYSFQDFIELIESFFYCQRIEINSPQKLAEKLAKKAKVLERIALKDLKADRYRENKSTVTEFHKGLRELIGEKTGDHICAEAFTETLIYGLFLAKLKLENKPIHKQNAVDYIPAEIRIIKKLFMDIYGEDLPEDMTGVVNSIIDILNNTNIKNLISHFQLNDQDPFIQFYEHFLKMFNPTRRKEMGVFYTPNSIVSFIVKSANYLLKTEFSKNLGLADTSVTVLDPCTGTGTFLAHAIDIGIKELKKNKYSTSVIHKKISDNFLKQFYGFEILVSPYILSHLKLSMVLEKEHYKLKSHERIPVYLTNSLDFHDLKNRALSAYLEAIRQEILKANDVKRKRILLIMGNPPYGSPKEFNKTDFTDKLLLDYKKGLKGYNTRAISNDYIKFIRFGQYKIEENKEGIVTFITDNSYLAGDMHIVMRKNLLSCFNKIYILNLYEGLRTKKRDSEDENVFDIREGVAIIILVKDANKNNFIKYADAPKKSKQKKFDFLNEKTIQTIKWEELKPTEENNFIFLPTSIKKISDSFNVQDIFKQKGHGVVTCDDDLYVSFTKNEFREKFKEKYNANFIKEYDYRPFDKRYIFCGYKKKNARFSEKFYGKLRKNPLILIIGRSGKVTKSEVWNLVFISRGLIDYNLFYRGGTTLYPLYYYEKETQKKLVKENIEKNKEQINLNLSDEFLKFIGQKYPKQKIDPENIIYYLYGILNSTNYRTKYKNNLKFLDYPSIPFVDNYTDFKKIADKGKELSRLHTSFANQKISSQLKGDGNSMVVSIIFKKNSIWVNETQYFSNVLEDVWNYEVGGFPVLETWLKERKNKSSLSIEDIETFGKIVTIIRKTLKIIKQIDDLTKNI